YIAFRALKDKELTPSQMVTVSEKAWRAEGSRMFIEPKKAVSVDELLRGEIVQSGNDAAIALAEAVSGSEEAFVVRVNQEATRRAIAWSARPSAAPGGWYPWYWARARTPRGRANHRSS